MKKQYYDTMVAKLKAAYLRASGKNNKKTKLELTMYQIEDLLILWEQYSMYHFEIKDIKLPFASKVPLYSSKINEGKE